jgi:hypothetical protein
MENMELSEDEARTRDTLAWLQLALTRFRYSRAYEPDSYAARHLREHGHDLGPGCCAKAYEGFADATLAFLEEELRADQGFESR